MSAAFLEQITPAWSNFTQFVHVLHNEQDYQHAVELLDIAMDFLDEVYREIRSSMPSRRTFFEQVRTLLQVIPFDSWEHFTMFMLDGQEKIPRQT